MVDRRDNDSVDVLVLQELSVILVTWDILFERLPRKLDARFGDVTNRRLSHVAFGGVFLSDAQMGLALAADADVADVDTVVGANDAPSGRGLISAVNRCFKASCRRGGRGCRRRFLNEGAT